MTQEEKEIAKIAFQYGQKRIQLRVQEYFEKVLGGVPCPDFISDCRCPECPQLNPDDLDELSMAIGYDKTLLDKLSI